MPMSQMPNRIRAAGVPIFLMLGTRIRNPSIKIAIKGMTAVTIKNVVISHDGIDDSEK